MSVSMAKEPEKHRILLKVELGKCQYKLMSLAAPRNLSLSYKIFELIAETSLALGGDQGSRFSCVGREAKSGL